MSNRQNELGKEKYFANRGVARNKTRLPNLRIKVEFCKTVPDEEIFKDYKFKEEGYINVFWTKNLQPLWYMDTSITVPILKKILSEKQWFKFCQGKRFFIIQRRIDGKNDSLNKC